MKKVINYAMYIMMQIFSILLVREIVEYHADMDLFTMAWAVLPIIFETMFVTNILIPDLKAFNKKHTVKKKLRKEDSGFKVLENKESA